MIQLITALLPLILKILGVYFESEKVSKDQRQAFMEFLLKMQSSGSTPNELTSSFENQLKRLREIDTEEK